MDLIFIKECGIPVFYIGLHDKIMASKSVQLGHSSFDPIPFQILEKRFTLEGLFVG